MEALYNRAKLLQHGAQSPDTPRSMGPTIQHLSQQAHAANRLTTVSKKCQLQSQVWVLSLPLRNTAPDLQWATATLHKGRLGTGMEDFKYVLTSTLHTQDANYSLTTELRSLFRKPWQCSVYSAISPGSFHTLFRLIIQKHGITFNFINGGTLDERCC